MSNCTTHVHIGIPAGHTAYQDLKAALADPDYVIEEAPFTDEIVDMRQVPRADIADLTASWLRRPCTSACRASNVQTVW